MPRTKQRPAARRKPDDRTRISRAELTTLLAKAAQTDRLLQDLDRANTDRAALIAHVENLDVQLEGGADTVLGEARSIVDGERQAAYGHPKANFDCAAWMISAYLTKRGTTRIDAHDVAMLQILNKVAREAHSRKRDNIVDIAGYARTAEMVDEAAGAAPEYG